MVGKVWLNGFASIGDCMICLQCRQDNPAGARFCLNCRARLPHLCPNCGTELPDDARFCMYCGEPLRARTAADEDRQARLVAAAPQPLAAKVRAAVSLSGERRVATILFLDVVGSTALAARLGVETWMNVLNGAQERLTPIIYRYEGTLARLLGDALVAFFGAPVAHEDDPIRAVRAALETMVEAEHYAAEIKRQYGFDFRMRACLNTGPVVIEPVGQDLRYDFTARDGAVNLAARLKFAAQPMRVLLTEATYRYVAAAFECRDLGVLEAKGHQPVRVYEVIRPKNQPGAGRGLTGLTSPMVGRDAELTTLIQLTHAVRAGLGRAVLILGEPGLGKTRLIQEWQTAVEHSAGAHPPRWAIGQCRSYGQGLAYHLVINLVRSLIGVAENTEEPETHAALQSFTRALLGDTAPDITLHLASLLLLQLEPAAAAIIEAYDPPTRQGHYLRAVRQTLLTLAQQQPLVLVFEDIHWADAASTALLTRLFPQLLNAPILLSLVTRPEQEAAGWELITATRSLLGGSLTEITLRALTETDSRRLVSNLLEIETLPETLRQLVLSKAEGNPFFVEEVIRMFIDREAIVRRNGGWSAGKSISSLDIPDKLEGLLLARIDRLPEDVKNTLRIAAVIGRQFPVKVLARVLGEETQWLS